MKAYLLISVFLFCLQTINAQVSTTFYFKNKLLEKKDEKWMIADINYPKKYYEVDSKVITVKFNTLSNEGLAKLKGKFNIKLFEKLQQVILTLKFHRVLMSCNLQKYYRD